MATSANKQSRPTPKAPLHQVVDADTDEAVPPVKKKKRSLLKVLLLLTPLAGGAAGGAWYFFGGDQEAVVAPKPGAAKPAAGKQVSSKPPVFVALDPFTVNLQHEDSSSQYLQVGLSLKVTDAAVVDAVKLHMPEIRNRVLLLLSGKKASEISTPEGKKALSTELTREIVQPLAGSLPARGVDSVLYTSFVIQ